MGLDLAAQEATAALELERSAPGPLVLQVATDGVPLDLAQGGRLRIEGLSGFHGGSSPAEGDLRGLLLGESARGLLVEFEARRLDVLTLDVLERIRGVRVLAR